MLIAWMVIVVVPVYLYLYLRGIRRAALVGPLPPKHRNGMPVIVALLSGAVAMALSYVVTGQESFLLLVVVVLLAGGIARLLRDRICPVTTSSDSKQTGSPSV